MKTCPETRGAASGGIIATPFCEDRAREPHIYPYQSCSLTGSGKMPDHSIPRRMGNSRAVLVVSDENFYVATVGLTPVRGVDRDDDGYFDLDEVDRGFDPADFTSSPGVASFRFA